MSTKLEVEKIKVVAALEAMDQKSRDIAVMVLVAMAEKNPMQAERLRLVVSNGM